MKNQPYDDHRTEDMVLRDWLAMDRTVFAATRTFNDYLKIVITAVIATLVFLSVVSIMNGVSAVLVYAGFVLAIAMLAVGVKLVTQAVRHHRRLHNAH